MTCRCSSPAEHTARAAGRDRENAQAALRRKETEHAQELAELRKALGMVEAQTVDAAKYEVLEAVQIGLHLVMKIRYACQCAFNGEKVLVFLNMQALAALRWRKIDPHFRDKAPENLNEAPSPSARFPATPIGWANARAWAMSKTQEEER